MLEQLTLQVCAQTLRERAGQDRYAGTGTSRKVLEEGAGQGEASSRAGTPRLGLARPAPDSGPYTGTRGRSTDEQ